MKSTTVRVLLASALATVLSCAFAGPTDARDVTRTCDYDQDTRTVKCIVMIVPAPPVVVSLNLGGEGARLPLEWRRGIWATPAELISRGKGCQREEGADKVVGVIYLTLLVNTDTSETLSFEYECVFPGDPLPQPPPPPPSLAEFLEAADLVLVADADVSPDPAWGGITGLETWLWCQDPGELEVGVSLRGWSAAATMRPVQYQWTVDGPEKVTFNATACGTEEKPGATWTPETKGSYEIGLSATWAGSWALTYAGVPMGVFVLGPVDVDAAPAAYPVGEYVGVLTDGGTG